MQTVVETEGLSKFFGDVVGIKNLNLTVEEGEIFGFLGPNGAGKTTTIRLLMNFIRPNQGAVRILGSQLKWGDCQYHKNIGYLSGEVSLPGNFTGAALLDYFSELSGNGSPARKRCLEALALSPTDLKRKIHQYSRGMKQKLGVALAIQNSPKLLILDEPTSGLDPLVKHSFLEFLKEIKIQGCTVFFSSHILSEVEHVADTAAIVRGGELVTKASIEELKSRQHKKVKIKFSAENGLNIFSDRYPCSPQREGLTLSLISNGKISVLLEALQGIGVEDIHIAEPELEEIFLQYYEADD